MESQGLTVTAFILAIVVGIAWALGSRIVEHFWPTKTG